MKSHRVPENVAPTPRVVDWRTEWVIDDGVKPPRDKHRKEAFSVPQDLRAAIDANSAAAATFDGFPPSAQREYVEWVTEAKRDETRAKRLVQTVEWLAEGKRRHWKYEAC